MKNQLIRTVLSAVVISALFLSCGKEKEADYFIKFKVDGQTIEFKKAAFIVEQSADPDPHYVLTVTSISETEIRGHFTGNFLADEDGNTAALTEGEFVAKLNQQ